MVKKIIETENLLDQSNTVRGQKLQKRALAPGSMNNMLNEKKEFYEMSIPENSLVSCLIVNKTGEIIEASSKCLDIFGYKNEELVGQFVEMLVPAQHQCAHIKSPKKIFGAVQAFQMGTGREIYALRKNGDRFPVEIATIPYTSNKQTYISVAIIDLSKNKEAEREVEQCRQQLNYMVDASDTIVYSVGFIPNNKNSFQTEFTSSNIYRILGYTEKQTTGNLTFWQQNIHPEDYDRVLAEFAQHFKANTCTGTIEYRFRDAKGAYHWIHDSFNVVYDQEIAGDQISAKILGAWTDITLQKQNEEDRNQLEIDLGLAQKLEAVGQLASGIAHEINTPIQYIGDSIHFLKTASVDLQVLIDKYQNIFKQCSCVSAYNELLDKIKQSEQDADLEYLQEHVPKTFDRIFDGLDRVSSIVRSMKEFAHADSTEKCPGDINKALLSTIAISRNEYKYVAEIITELGEIPLIPCYIGELNQVFLNLIVNAAHAIGDVVQKSGEKGQIHIVTRQEEEAIIISVKDTGGGIPKEIRNRIFDPFFTTKEVGKGSGQGLALAYSIIVEKHGGELTFESEVDQGTTFVIRLPKGNLAHEDEALAI